LGINNAATHEQKLTNIGSLRWHLINIKRSVTF
jgi:hypothetical protein